MTTLEVDKLFAVLEVISSDQLEKILDSFVYFEYVISELKDIKNELKQFNNTLSELGDSK